MKKASIHFFEENIRFRLRHKLKIRKWIDAVFLSENTSRGEINFIFCDDSYLHDLNVKYLQHDTLTDIITFDQSENPEQMDGDIFISIERVKENAKQYGVSFVNELHRVMVHGVLHLCGYHDKAKNEIKVMREKEDYYLSLQPDFFN
ncbi:MAG: rRNA maturation RNase YbeY [Bacteroidales bacterium]|nr:rRNA maturation RNase YbeY [Bacteroidales bacterium]